MTFPAARPDPAWPAASGSAPAPQPTSTGWSTLQLLALVAAVAALGVPLGLLWTLLAPDVPVQVVDNGAAFVDAQPRQPVAADAWFTLLAVPFGILVAIGAWRVHRVRGAAGLLALVAGAVVAGLVAWLVGRQIGLTGFEQALATAAPGTVLHRPPDLRVAEAGWWPPLAGAPLVPALVAALTYTVLAAWARLPTLRP